MTKIDFYVGTHIGQRKCNEDSFLSLPGQGVWAIADGMGGHGSGDLASQLAVQEMEHAIKGSASISEAINAAHLAIQTAAQKGVGHPHMGSTVVALHLEGLDYEIAWVGDSRAYLFSRQLHQISTDHSYIQMLVESGMITPEEALIHPNRNIIVQALGVGGSDTRGINIGQISGSLNSGDSLLLCSDGLSNEVSDQDIASILAEEADNKSKVQRLIETALAAGGKDNITAVLVTAY